MKNLKKWNEHTFDDVYILGAGSSFVYNYPVGVGLRRQIINLEKGSDEYFTKILMTFNNTSNPDIQNEYPNFGKELQELTNAFKASGSGTIDSFIAKNPSFLKTGQILVSYILKNIERTSNHEYHDEKSDSPPYWMNYYLEKRIGDNFIDYLKNPDCFISFNYDLLLEDHFKKYFKNQEIVPFSKIKDELQSLPIFHVYGCLNEYKLNRESFNPSTLNDFIKCSQGIKFIDRKSEKENYITLQNILRRAKRIIILGYGFDPDNNDILFGGMKGLQSNSNPKIYSTSKGLSTAEVERFKQLRFPKLFTENYKVHETIKVEMHDMECLDLLKNYVLIKKFFNDE